MNYQKQPLMSAYPSLMGQHFIHGQLVLVAPMDPLERADPLQATFPTPGRMEHSGGGF